MLTHNLVYVIFGWRQTGSLIGWHCRVTQILAAVTQKLDPERVKQLQSHWRDPCLPPQSPLSPAGDDTDMNNDPLHVALVRLPVQIKVAHPNKQRNDTK